MKIGIEAERANIANPTGVERFAAEIIKNLARLDRNNEYVLYFRSQPQSWFAGLPGNFKLKVIPFPKFWTQTRLAWELFRNPVDVFFMPIQALPFFHPKKSVITVHDIAYEFYPRAFGAFMRFYLKLTTRWGVRRASRIVTVSESTKRDVIKFYGAPEGKVAAAHLGLSGEFAPADYAQVQPVLDKYGLSYKKYLLFVGTLQPRKNIIRLIDAYLQLKKRHHIEEKLVIAGGKGWLWQPIYEKIMAHRPEGVVYLEYAPAADLPKLYAGAVLLTLPALYEGFGLPPLEAMACGTPVVVSNVSSLPEVAGEAGVLVDPNRTESIAQGLLQVLTDKALQEDLRTKGLARARQFSWEACAKQILSVIQSLS